MKYYIKLSTFIGDLYVIERASYITNITIHKEEIEGAILRETTNLLLAKAWLSNYFKGSLDEVTFPVKQLMTPFMERVYQETTKIPFGQTLSYKELAKRIGSPKAFRAVGTALGKNNLLILMPCHRVIKTSGELGGFTGGIDLKIKLLEHETVRSK